MVIIWQSKKKAETGNTFSGTTFSSWSRQQKLAQHKLAAFAGFAILGLLLAASACSKQSSKPALHDLSSPASASASIPAETAATRAIAPNPQVPTPQATIAKVKKAAKKRPANVTYSDPNSGVSFVYPRKFALASGDKTQTEFAGMDVVPMNFVQPGGVHVVTVALPGNSYPGTDFAIGFFTVNLNRSLSAQECPHFTFVDTNDADGEPIDAERVQVGSTGMEMTSEFAGSATSQLETQYYHDYENGACYEYVLGLGTAGYAAKQGIEPVNRDQVFSRLEKILVTVKVHPVAQEQAAEQSVAAAGK